MHLPHSCRFSALNETGFAFATHLEAPQTTIFSRFFDLKLLSRCRFKPSSGARSVFLRRSAGRSYNLQTSEEPSSTVMWCRLRTFWKSTATTPTDLQHVSTRACGAVAPSICIINTFDEIDPEAEISHSILTPISAFTAQCTTCSPT